MYDFVKKSILVWLLAVCTFFAWTSHQELKLLSLETGEDPNVYYIPKASAVKPVLLGHEALLADFVWIRTLGYFADEMLSGKTPKYLEDLINFATDLDPRFEKLYIWAGAVSMYGTVGPMTRKKIEASNNILKKGWSFIQNDPIGWKHIPDYWLIPQMIGFNYAVELGQKKKGAPYIAMAGQIPGAPSMYKTWGATLYNRAGDVENATKVLENMLAIEVLEGQLQNVDSEEVKGKIRRRLSFFYEKLYGKEQAEIRAINLMKSIDHLKQVWQENFSYISLGLFLSMWQEDYEPFQI